MIESCRTVNSYTFFLVLFFLFLLVLGTQWILALVPRLLVSVLVPYYILLSFDFVLYHGAATGFMSWFCPGGFVIVLVFQGRSQPHSPGWARVPLFSLKFGSSFLTFPQTFLIFFLILAIRWASRPPGKAMATRLWSFLFPTSSWFTLPVSFWRAFWPSWSLGFRFQQSKCPKINMLEI